MAQSHLIFYIKYFSNTNSTHPPTSELFGWFDYFHFLCNSSIFLIIILICGQLQRSLSPVELHWLCAHPSFTSFNDSAVAVIVLFDCFLQQRLGGRFMFAFPCVKWRQIPFLHWFGCRLLFQISCWVSQGSEFITMATRPFNSNHIIRSFSALA